MNSDRQALVLGVVPARATLESAVPEDFAQAHALLDGLFDRACAGHRGVPVSGAVLGRVFAFDSIDDAAAFCLAVQRGALELDWPEHLLRRPECATEEVDGEVVFRGLRVAMAVDLQIADEVGLQELARLVALAEAGRVVLSAQAARAGSVEAVSIGALERPGLPGRRLVYELKADDLARTFGEPEPLPWPAASSPLLGREGDLAALEELTALGMRVVCVSGEPGVGKSRLLRRFTRDKARRGARVIALDLGHARSAWDVVGALARPLGVPVREERGIEQIVQRIAAAVLAAPGIAIVVDHVTQDFAAKTLAEVVRRAPGSRWIIGGAARLGVAAEVGYVVGTLADRDAGAALFEQMARRIAPELADLGSEGQAIALELHNNPLAIELAASCVSRIRPLALFDRLSSGRGPSMRVLALAIALRPAAELEMLSRLSVFQGPFNVDGAIAVTGGTAEILRRLQQAGLIRVHQPIEAPGASLLSLHPRVRDALRELHPPDPDVYLRLAEWLAARCDAWCGLLWGVRSDAVLARLSIERETLHDVIARLEERPRLAATELTVFAALLEGAVRLAIWQGGLMPLLEPLERALHSVGMCLDADPLVAVRLFRTRGMAREHLEQDEAALGDLERAESLAERWAEPGEVARARFHSGRLRLRSRQYERAREDLAGAVAGFEEVGRPLEAAHARALLAAVDLARGDLDSAAASLAQARSECVEGAPWLQAEIDEAEARLLGRQGRLHEARDRYAQALDTWIRVGRWDAAAITRVQLAVLLQGIGELEAAAVLFSEAERIARRWGDSPRRGLVLTQLGLAQLELGDRPLAHRTFIQALSASRAGGDRAGQGAAKGFLGLLHHLAGRLDEAREGYRGALRDLESGGDRRYGALFHSCLSAAEAELGNLEEARILVDLAQLQLPDADPSLRDAMVVFHRAIDLARAEAAESSGDLATAKDLRDGVDDALAQLEGAADNIYLRFARSHLAALAKGSR